jgi:hypothetical protein
MSARTSIGGMTRSSNRWRRLARVYLRPTETFAELARDPDRLRIGALAMLGMSALYTIVPIFLTILHGVPVPPPFLRIAPERYFYWASYFYLPALLAGWVFGSAIIQIVARSLGGKGTFEDTLALVGFATAAATAAALIPDLIVTSVQIAGLLDYGIWRRAVDTFLSPWFLATWAYLLAYLVLFLAFYAAVGRELHGLGKWRARLTSLVGFLAYQGFILIFIR